jgi:hypothetical protein
VVALFDARRSPEQIRSYVEFLYAQATCSLAERLAYVRKPTANPYRAQFNGNYHGQIICGHNPWLYARIVENVRSDGDDKLIWTEHRIPPIVLAVQKHGVAAYDMVREGQINLADFGTHSEA